jgi:hypothetical protein
MKNYCHTPPLFCVASGLMGIIFLSSTAWAAPVTAKPADAFVGSIGVNTHWPQSDIYLTRYADLKARLGESGIRVIRDGAAGRTFERANDLYQSFGIRTIMLTGKRLPGGWPQPLDPTQIDAELNDIETAAAATLAIEGPNEYDISHPSSEDSSWVTKVKSYQQSLYPKVKSRPLLQNLLVIGPSLTSEAAYDAVGNLSSIVDASNVHPYMAGRHPETGGWGTNGYGSLAWVNSEQAQVQAPGKPIVATEGGNSTADPYNVNNQWSETAHGRYIPRYLLQRFNAGYKWTCIYELLDQRADAHTQSNYGLLRNDLTPKPAFTAIKNLIGLLKDPGAAHTPTSLDFSLSGATTNVQSSLLQKRNGDFYLCLWLAKSSWQWRESTVAAAPINVAPQNVTVTLPSSVTSATAYRLDDSGNLSNSALALSNGVAGVSVTDRITVIKITPGGGLKGQYYSGANFNTLVNTQIDPQIDFDWLAGSPQSLDGTTMSSIGPDTFSVRWTGQIVPRYSQAYTFHTSSDDGVRLWVGTTTGTPLVDKWITGSNLASGTTAVLTAGQKYDLKVEYFENTGQAKMKLEWRSTSQAREIVPQSQLFPAP